MFYRSFYRINSRISSDGKIVIVGAGKYGKELAGMFIDCDRKPICFMDNNSELHGLNIYGIPVRGLEATDKETFYVISVENDDVRSELKRQLEQLGISTENIFCYYHNRCNAYHKELLPDEYNEEIKSLYKDKMGEECNLECPVKFSEIINWEKINVFDERRTKLADKVYAKEWAANILGNEHVTKTYGVWNNADDIDFARLPDRFVLKANNGSGRNIIVKDKKVLDIDEAKRKLNGWLRLNFAFNEFEMHYKDIPPRIIAEEYLDGLAESVYDYNIFCFNGEPKYIWCIKGSHRADCCASFYDQNWNMQPFSLGYPLDIWPAPKPNNLEKMLELSRILSKEFKHVRVDWYNMPDGRVLFGEMTFSTWSGLRMFVPKKYDRYFGDLINNN